MPAKPQEGSDHFDLLPFIAILMCVLGCLLLVTLSMSAISVGVGAGEGWLVPAKGARGPGNEGIPSVAGETVAEKTPILIEWDGTTAVIHRDGELVSVAWTKPSGGLLPKGLLGAKEDQWIAFDKSPDTQFQDAVARMVPLRDQYYALFAVRPSGFKNFQRMADEFRGRKIDVGFEPIDQTRPVRLLFKGSQHAPPTIASAVP